MDHFSLLGLSKPFRQPVGSFKSECFLSFFTSCCLLQCVAWVQGDPACFKSLAPILPALNCPSFFFSEQFTIKRFRSLPVSILQGLTGNLGILAGTDILGAPLGECARSSQASLDCLGELGFPLVAEWPRDWSRVAEGREGLGDHRSTAFSSYCPV